MLYESLGFFNMIPSGQTGSIALTHTRVACMYGEANPLSQGVTALVSIKA